LVVATQGRGLSLLAEVREAQGRALWQQGLLYGGCAGVILFMAGGLAAHLRPTLGQWLVVFAPIAFCGVSVVFGVFLARRRIGDEVRTARLVAARAPELSLDLLAAVELSRAMGKREDFSPKLARAFIDEVDQRASTRPVASLVDARPLRLALGVAGGTLLAAILTLGMAAEHVVSGVFKAFSVREASSPRRREPITGDFELSYRYPEYTGLEPRTVQGTAGDISGPAGTEVSIKARADREVKAAHLVVNGGTVPLSVSGRDLVGSFVLDTPGQYHVAFLNGRSVEAEGPDIPIAIEPDAAPVVRLLAPIDVVELDPKRMNVRLQYEASDDFGLASLELVYRSSGGSEQRTPLTLDEARAARGTYEWDVSSLGLKPGGEVNYFVEAKDGNTVKGAQKGVSRTQTLKLYSAAEHRRDALRRAEALWERLVTHLADRQESLDRKVPIAASAIAPGALVDERAAALAKDFSALADSLGEEREPMPDLVAALSIIGRELDGDTRFLMQRRAYLRRNADLAARSGHFEQGLSFALSSRLAADLASSEKNVLYLESLLDRARLDAIRELARALKEDRRELTRLVEQFQKTNDSAVREQLLDQMRELKARMRELQERMAEMAKGIRDEFMNEDALEQLRQDLDLESPLDEIEKLVREGKADEALKKMQELSMELDEMFDQLEKGAESAEQNADPELAQEFQDFTKALQETTQEQQRLADQTRKLKEKSRAAAKERIAKQGDQVKRELGQKLEELERSLATPPPADRYGGRLEEQQNKALQSVRNTQQALESNDFDLALESSRELLERSDDLKRTAEEQSETDRRFGSGEPMQRESRRFAERTTRDEKKAREIVERLDSLFPQSKQSLDSADQQQLRDLAKQQQKLSDKGQQLKEQMKKLGEAAPIFDEESQGQMAQAADRMQAAGERLQGRDVNRGNGEQQGALQSLQNLQQQMQQAQRQRGGKGGLPMPMRSRRNGNGRSTSDQKVEIPDEDPSANPREFRKDVMDAMKQGAPDRYREQNKKYYEELVK
jgi:hypothetical protein